jgi:hypothetical protein
VKLLLPTEDTQSSILLNILDDQVLEGQIEAAAQVVAGHADRASRVERELAHITSEDPFLHGRAFTWRQVRDLFGDQKGHQLWQAAVQLQQLVMTHHGPAVLIKVAACVF